MIQNTPLQKALVIRYGHNSWEAIPTDYEQDIEPGPLITQAKAAHEAMLKQKAPNALAPAGSSAPDKKNASANENSEEKPKTTKRKANPVWFV